MGAEKAGLCFTSPPYDQQRTYDGGIGDWLTLMKGVFSNLPMAEDGQVLVNLGIYYRDGDWVDYWTPWIIVMNELGWRSFGWYVWDKLAGLPGDWCGRCSPAHEWIFHFNRKSVRPLHIIPKKEASIKPTTGSSFRYQDGTLKTMNSPESGLNTHKIPDSVWRMNRAITASKIEANHSAVYPIELPAFAMRAWPGDVFEPFSGSGTTMLAAHQLNRRCFGLEISQNYCAVILERMQLAGLEPKLA
jgi:DNA modification methylase